jgi:hypothetical protein
MWKFIFEFFAFYLLFKFVFDFIIPIYNTTRDVKQKVTKMQRHMEEMEKNTAAQDTQKRSKETTPLSRIDGEYIDYDEIK